MSSNTVPPEPPGTSEEASGSGADGTTPHNDAMHGFSVDLSVCYAYLFEPGLLGRFIVSELLTSSLTRLSLMRPTHPWETQIDCKIHG
jgi:hypothetical protein